MGSSLVILALGDAQVAGTLARVASPLGWTVLEAQTAADAEALLGGTFVDVVVAELGSAGREAGTLLHLLHERAPDLPLVALAPADDRARASELLRLGAFIAVARDESPEVLRALVSRAAEHHSLRRDVARLRREVSASRDRVPLLGRSERMREMNHLVDEAADRMVPVLVVGAVGTGKSFLARELHARSPRASGPFVSVSCDAGCETLIASQLFGHRRGAFAGASQDHEGAFRSASGGTLYVERIDRLPLPLQGALLAAMRTSKVTPLGGVDAQAVDVRLASSSPRDLEPLARSGRFREDLLHALASVVLKLPALHERREDISFLAEAFAAEEAERFGVATRRFDAETLDALLAHSWPDNVRELRHAVRHAFARGVGDTIHRDQLPPSARAGARVGFLREPDRLPTLAEAEAELVALVLEDSAGNKTLASRRLGIDRKRLYRKIKRYGLACADEPDDEGPEPPDTAGD